MLYGLIHAWYILTPKGIDAMVFKYIIAKRLYIFYIIRDKNLSGATLVTVLECYVESSLSFQSEGMISLEKVSSSYFVPYATNCTILLAKGTNKLMEHTSVELLLMSSRFRMLKFVAVNSNHLLQEYEYGALDWIKNAKITLLSWNIITKQTHSRRIKSKVQRRMRRWKRRKRMVWI